MDSYRYLEPALRKGNLVWKDSVGGNFLGKGDVRQRSLPKYRDETAVKVKNSTEKLL